MQIEEGRVGEIEHSGGIVGIKGQRDVPFPPLKPRKFTTITSDSDYLPNRPQNQIIFRHLRIRSKQRTSGDVVTIVTLVCLPDSGQSLKPLLISTA